MTTIAPGMPVRTNASLESIMNLSVHISFIMDRQPETDGVVEAPIQLHGGRAWWVRHADGKLAAYWANEFTPREVTEDLFYVGTSRAAFRPGEWAYIDGVCMHTPAGLEPRLCYKVRYPDGVTDLVVVDTSEHPPYQLLTQAELDEEVRGVAC